MTCHDTEKKGGVKLVVYFFYIYSMGFTRLTEAYLPGFIYLIDSIMEEEYDLNFTEIADTESKAHEMVVPRSIDRAFDLRQKLIDGWEAKKDKPGRPAKKTLDVLTAFAEGNSKRSFLDYTIVYKEEIEAFYVHNKPSEQWINAIFGKKHNKVEEHIIRMEEKRDDIAAVLEDYSLEELKNVLGPKAKQQLMLLLEEWKSDELEPFFKHILEIRLKKLEDKIANSRTTYRRFGLFCLLFLPQDDEFLFEENLFSAIKDYQVNISDDSDVDESLLEVIAEFGG